MIMHQEENLFKSKAQQMKNQFEQFQTMIQEAAKNGESIGTVEKQVWNALLHFGQHLLQHYVNQHGTGDCGSTLELDGKSFRRLENLHTKRYMSVFGPITIERTVYGTREKQKHEVVPLDARLNLPESDFSYLLQEWSQGFCVQGSYSQSSATIARILGLKQSVRSLEHMNQTMAQEVDPFQSSQPVPEAKTEGPILVCTADGKGVPMCQETQNASTSHGRRKKGEKANKKRQACVGAAYTIHPFYRSAQDVVDELFREKRKAERPRPCNKELRAKLTQDINGVEVNGKDQIFQWFVEQQKARNAKGDKAVVCIMDGERALWKKAKKYGVDAIGILDLYHVMEHLWTAAYCFCKEGSEEAEIFVRTRLTSLLEGKVGRVIGGLRQMQTKHSLRGKKKEQLEKVITYLENNRDYMHYDYYLDCGYPIGSGVVEGACRHLVKDRMEGTGMRWRTPGAQAMLDLRSVYLNDDWEAFHEHRVKHNVKQLYPYREKIQTQWRLAA